MLSDKCYSCPSDFSSAEEIRTVSPEAFGKASNHIYLYTPLSFVNVFSSCLMCSSNCLQRFFVDCMKQIVEDLKSFFFIEIVSHKNSFCAPGTLAWKNCFYQTQNIQNISMF